MHGFSNTASCFALWQLTTSKNGLTMWTATLSTGGNIVIVTAQDREMSTTTNYHAADKAARQIMPGCKLVMSGTGISGYANRFYGLMEA